MARNDIGLRFIWAAIWQGLLAALVTAILFAYGSIYFKPAPAMVIASGSAGTWMFIGYITYIVMVIAIGVTGLLYEFIEARFRGSITGIPAMLANAHLVLMNIGVIGATWLLMYAGYRGGTALLPASSGGLGLTTLQAHEQILSVYPTYIVIFIIATIIGMLCGGAAFVLSMHRKGSQEKANPRVR
ncbi:MAG: hypothetical protein KGH58_00490 [Candidatus Micrarchaeota archaeon]|nr:hypothetical protein [Candidatus Micrarchaeota archaeon]